MLVSTWSLIPLIAFEVEGILPFQCGQSWRAVLGEEAGRSDTLHCFISIVKLKTLST